MLFPFPLPHNPNKRISIITQPVSTLQNRKTERDWVCMEKRHRQDVRILVGMGFARLSCFPSFFFLLYLFINFFTYIILTLDKWFKTQILTLTLFMPLKNCAPPVIKRCSYVSHITKTNRCQRHMTCRSKHTRFSEAFAGLSKNQVSVQICGATLQVSQQTPGH